MKLVDFVKALKYSNSEQAILFYLAGGQTETTIWTGNISDIPIIYAEYPMLSLGSYCDTNGVIHLGIVM